MPQRADLTEGESLDRTSLPPRKKSDNSEIPSCDNGRMKLVRLLRWAPLASLLSWSPIASAQVAVCGDAGPCQGAAPVCDTLNGVCVACATDFNDGGLLSCPTAALPACQTTDAGLLGRCTECSATNQTQCSPENRPTCNANVGSCGCTLDNECGQGKLCNVGFQPAGRCEPGCRVGGGGNDNCPTNQFCSAQDGGAGTCNPQACSPGNPCPVGTCNTMGNVWFCECDGGPCPTGDGGAGGDGGTTNDGGAGGDGGTGDGGTTGDGGSTSDGGNTGDGGTTSDGGNTGDGSSGDATVNDGSSSNDGSSGNDATVGSDGSGTGSGDGSTGGPGGDNGNGNNADSGLIEGGGCSCSVRGTDGPASVAAGLGLLLGVAAFVRRRSKK